MIYFSDVWAFKCCNVIVGFEYSKLLIYRNNIPEIMSKFPLQMEEKQLF